MGQEKPDTDRRHEIALVERLVQEGRSQAEIETALDHTVEKLGTVRETLRRLLGATSKKAA